MQMILDVLLFRRMVSPAVLQLLFWAGIGGVLYGTYVLLELEQWAWPYALVFGTLLVRVLFERAIIAFQSYDRLGQICDELHDLNTRSNS